ncbi:MULTISPECIES: GGDEF domain-containing phosphodiesterase [unclassified Exiguobacterium]|uniref:sensor domain-containing protein n=1 Tax=unclassified Exiguobacterium TaxID=2644629 RepID=UPI0013758987|nr:MULTISPECIES: GGDEF domain-containing phosphodiesterase [unclassified Exiguobacterium]
MTRFAWTNRLKSRLAASTAPLTKAAQDRNFVEGHLDPVYMIDVNGRFIDMNEKLALLLGYSTAAMYEHFSTFIHPDDVEFVTEQFERVLTGNEETYLCRALHQSGRVLTLQITNIPAYDNQLIVGVYGIARDVTQEERLKAERERLLYEQRLLTEAPGLTYFSFDVDGVILKCSDSLHEAVGRPVTSWDQLVRRMHPDDQVNARRVRDALFQGQTLEEPLEFRLLGPIEHHYVGKMGKFNDTARGVFTNVTAHHLLTKTVAAHAKRLEELYDHVDASIYKKTLATGHLEFYTRGFEVLFDTTQEAMALDPNAHRHMIHPNDRMKVRAAHTKAEAGETVRIVFRVVTGNEVRWVEKQLIPQMEGDTPVAVISVARDVSRLKEQEEQIWQLAMHDSLTGLPNRSLFVHELEEWIEQHDHVAVLSVSFNSIHLINRDFGYAIGDEWIVAATSALLHRLPKSSFVAHLGGDEFILLLADAVDEAALALHCKSLIRLEDKTIHIGPYEWRPPVTVGVSRYPEDSDVAEELLQYANTALGRTNAAGADRFVFYTSNFNIELFRRHQLGNDLRRAIEEDELFLEFQPKVEAWSGRITGAEALVRWQHPEWGRIPPNDFIALSEESELHIKLADWVLKRTCAYLQDWQQRGLPVVPVSINVSPKRLLHGNYAETIKRVLRHYNVPASLFEIEILETDVLSDNFKIHEVLEQLEAANVQIALDDFGTGYSSLSYLQNYPIKTIKIDQQFAADLHENKKSQAIVRTILFMAEEFSMNVVIEGVETLEQLEAVRQLKCRIVQGYLFSRPLGEEDFVKALEERYMITTETASANSQQVFSLDARVTIHRFHDRIVHVGSTPIVLTKSSLRSVHFYAKIRLPVLEEVELKIVLPSGAPVYVRLVTMTEMGDGMYEYEAVYKDQHQAHRVVTSLQEQKR